MANFFNAAAAVAQFRKQCGSWIEVMQAIQGRIISDIAFLDRRQQDDRADSRIGHRGKPLNRKTTICPWIGHMAVFTRMYLIMEDVTRADYGEGGAFFGILHFPVFLLTTKPSSHLPPGPGSSPSFCASN